MNSFSRFLGLEPLASERGVASVGDPAQRRERKTMYTKLIARRHFLERITGE